jgi:hypothetical protein
LGVVAATSKVALALNWPDGRKYHAAGPQMPARRMAIPKANVWRRRSACKRPIGLIAAVAAGLIIGSKRGADDPRRISGDDGTIPVWAIVGCSTGCNLWFGFMTASFIQNLLLTAS